MFLKRISAWLYKVSNGWVVLTGLVVFLLFSGLVLPAQSSSAEEVSGGSGSPDMSFFYTSQNLFDMADAYGEQGRTAYIRNRFTFDLIWPLVYGFFLCTTISWSIQRAGLWNTPLDMLNLAPVMGVIFDYFENITTSWVMFRFPQLALLPAILAPFLTAIKWIFVGGSFGILVLGIITVLWDKFRPKKE